MSGQPLPPKDLSQNQPRPPKVAQPQAPVAKTVPQPVVPSNQVNGAQKKSNKGLIFGIVGGVIALILAIIGIIIAIVLLSGPSEKDYNEARQALSEAGSAYSKIVSQETKMIYDSNSKSENGAEKLKEALAELNEKFDKLSKMPAITKDKEVKEKWEAVAAKREKINDLVNFEVELSEKVLPIYYKTEKMNSLSEVDSVEDVIDELNEVSINDDATKTFMKECVVYLEALKEYMGNKSNYSAYRKYSKARSTYSKAVSKWQSSLVEKVDNANIKVEVSALAKILRQKERGE